MSEITSRGAKALLALLLVLVGSFGLAGPATAHGPAPADATALQAPCGDTAAFRKVALSGLPAQATDTVRLIQRGGPYPYPQDNQTFQNRERILPACATGYYKEYTVKTPGSSTRGARRIVTGNATPKLYFYTADHYASFVLVDVTR
ncbi:guanyl-specific ribonuclease Sa [Saccharothrix tamanrassetensis]|uniref:Guanyl-specific ribonuclease Sa n=1 Tax=Saccharothrix tamanrassetensis TaxID=1051531 RepID=A0A841CAF0_9PSEU|nr:ribonuclease domain-containing protein [Saccharothrix tamanrassetensis]MBB5955482.1 guanyl-specific ribonuclease Sa [Saccharothrix tamanrassetensis]